VAELGEIDPVPPGAARGVEGDADGERVDDRAHHRLLELDHLVARLVVEGGPRRIALAGRQCAGFDAAAELVGSLEQGADLVDALVHERAVPPRSRAAPSRPSRYARGCWYSTSDLRSRRGRQRVRSDAAYIGVEIYNGDDATRIPKSALTAFGASPQQGVPSPVGR
jgi:hypothetical protein